MNAQVVGVCVVGLATASAVANTVRLVPDRAAVLPGEVVSVSVIADVMAPTGFDITSYNLRVEGSGVEASVDLGSVTTAPPFDFVSTLFSSPGALFEFSASVNAFAFDFGSSGATLFSFDIVAGQEAGVFELSLGDGTVDGGGAFSPLTYGDPRPFFLLPVVYDDIVFEGARIRVVPGAGALVPLVLTGVSVAVRRRR